jgi:DNA-binding NarL/FixJ family response regulator
VSPIACPVNPPYTSGRTHEARKSVPEPAAGELSTIASQLTGIVSATGTSRPVSTHSGSGIAATRTLLASAAAPKVLVVTTFENDEYVHDALRAGASGFLLKRSPPGEIVQGVRTVARGESLLFPASIRSLVRSYGTPRHDDRIACLTERDQEVLRLMAGGLSNAEVAATLYLGVETVKTHVGSVLAKLGARDRTQAVIVAYESGFVGLR